MLLSEGIKKIMLAGIGAVAVTAERSRELIDELVAKGELTVEQGRILNEELTHKKKADQLLSRMEHCTPEELDAIQKKLDELQQKKRGSTTIPID